MTKIVNPSDTGSEESRIPFYGVSVSSAFSSDCDFPKLTAPIHSLDPSQKESIIHLIRETLQRNEILLKFQGTTGDLTFERPDENDQDIVYFRELEPADIVQCKQLHAEWFPLTYDEDFYMAIQNKKVFSLGAVYRPGKASFNSSQEYLLGIILASQLIGKHLNWTELAQVMSPTSFHQLQHDVCLAVENKSEAVPPLHGSRHYHVDQNIPVVYILSLGVAQEFRGLSIAKKLWQLTLDYFTSYFVRESPVFYLHVVTYNQAAMKFYQKMGFRYILTCTKHYVIQKKKHDALLYAYRMV